MIMIEKILFKNRKPRREGLLSFGFEDKGDGYTYLCDIVDGQMSLSVTVRHDGEVNASVIDGATGEEYVLHRVPSAEGTFVGRVKSEYEAILKKISDSCFDAEIFKSEQARAVIEYVKDKYGDCLEYLWEKFPENAVVRRKDNKKWYLAILTVCRRKLGFDSDETAEILDLRMTPENIEKEVDGVRLLCGYHMNKRHWITVCLDGTVPTEEIFERIDESYRLAIK